jgi:hypothetical protein
VFIQPEETKAEKKLTDYLSLLQREGDLLLLSTEFFPVTSDIFSKSFKNSPGKWLQSNLTGRQAENRS